MKEAVIIMETGTVGNGDGYSFHKKYKKYTLETKFDKLILNNVIKCLYLYHIIFYS